MLFPFGDTETDTPNIWTVSGFVIFVVEFFVTTKQSSAFIGEQATTILPASDDDNVSPYGVSGVPRPSVVCFGGLIRVRRASGFPQENACCGDEATKPNPVDAIFLPSEELRPEIT